MDGRSQCRLDDPRRCQAVRKFRGPCTRWSEVASRDENGKGYCKFHGGRRRRGLTYARKSLPMIYSKKLGPTLTEAIKSVTKTDEEVTSLIDELTLARALLLDTMPLIEAGAASGSVDLKMSATQLAFTMLENIRKIADSAQKIKDAKRAAIDVRDIHTIVNQLLLAVHKVAGDDEELVEELTEVVKDTVRLPNTGGTTLTTDHDAKAMDEQVPLVTE